MSMSDMKLLLLYLFCPWAGLTLAQQIRPGVVTVSEGDNAFLPCALGSGQSIDEFDWRKENGDKEKKEVFYYVKGSYYGNGRKGQNEQFKDRVVFFQHELKSGNASIIIKNTRLEDNGTYTCVLFQPYRQEVNIRLNVDGVLKIRNVTGASRLPNIQTIHDKITWRLLECKSQGVPEPEIEWRNSAGEVLAKLYPDPGQNGRSQVGLPLKVTKSDNYTCVATQWNIFHQISNTMEVSIPESVAVVEGTDAVLPCSLDSKHNIKSMSFSWSKDDEEVFLYDRDQVKEDKQFKGRLSHFQHELKSGNASIKIHKTQMSDSGRYSCQLPNFKKSHVILQVVEHSTGLEVTVAVAITTVILLFVFGIIIAVLCAKIHSLKNITLTRPESEPLSDIKSS